MSFIDNAVEVLDRTETSLQSLMTEALKAKAYREVAAIAAMAESVAAIGPGRSQEGRRAGGPASELGVGAAAAAAAADTAKSAEPSWLRPKTS